jgi:hypothetical protein
MLVGGQDLNHFANQQVEVHGTFDPAQPGTTAAGASATSQTQMRSLRVTSVRTVGPCPR